ncbi:MAG: type IV secretory system conjugative DNA transfer family protein [Breznakibacter sp.]
MNQERKALLLFTVFLACVVIIDYFSTIDSLLIEWIPRLNGILNNKAFYSTFVQNGEYIRAGFCGIFLIYAYNEVISLSLKAHDFDKRQYIIITAFSTVIISCAFIFIRHLRLEHELLVVLYPLFWILTMVSCYHFAKALSIRTKIVGDETDLNGEKEPRGMISLQTTENRFINILNQFQGILVVGSAGSGKTASVGIPILYEAVKNQFTGIVYSYKKFDLADVVNTAYHYYPETADSVALKVINFTNMHKTHRINPIHPNYIFNESFIDEYVSCIVKNLNKEWIKKQDFFATSSMLLLKAVITFLKNRHPDYCSIPHAFSIINHLGASDIVEMLSHDPKAKVISSSLAEGVTAGAGDQTAGVIASIKNVTIKLDNENFFWVLSGNDIDLNLNMPDRKTMLVLVNDPQTEETITPLISLIVTVARKLMNVPGRAPSIFALDEAPTLFIPNFDTLPATGRSNKISVLYMCQDLSQMEETYTEVGSRKIKGSLSNTFYGNCAENKTLKYISESFGKVDKIIENQSIGRNKSTGSVGQSDNVSYNVQERFLIKDSEVASFKIGEFCGKIIGNEEKPFFRVRFGLLEESLGMKPDSQKVPDYALMCPHITDTEVLHSCLAVHENYLKIIEEVKTLQKIYIKSEIEKLNEQ